jgi:hypothetical protein
MPLPLLPEEVEEGGIIMLDGLPNWATHSVTSLVNHGKSRRGKKLTLHTAVITTIVPARGARAI